MRSAAKVLRFPLSGVARDIDYRKAYIPEEETTFASPFALNVRGGDSLHRRFRGGSRPGLSKIEGVVATSLEGAWAWPNGEEVCWPDGSRIVYEKSFAEVLAPNGTRILNFHFAPNAQGVTFSDKAITATYRNRVVVADGSNWYMSATGDATNWDFGTYSEDPSRAVAGNVALAGQKGDDITAVMPIRDKSLFIATRRSLWRVDGEATSGSVVNVSEHVGCVSANAWAFDGTNLWLVAASGLYVCELGGSPLKVSTRIPEEFLGMTDALMAFDIEENALHVFGNKADGTASDWFYDIANKAFWPQSFESIYRPLAVCRMIMDGRNVCVLRCADGAWRFFDYEATSDDGKTEIASEVAIGPIRSSLRDDMDGLVGEISATLAENSADATLSIYCAKSPEVAVKAAEADLGSPFTAILEAGHNNVYRPRQRGTWAVFVIRSKGRWGYESMTAVMKSLGRLR